MNPRVVIDTNVLVSSFHGGPPREIIDLWRGHAVTLCLSPPIVEEYRRVLARLGVPTPLIQELFAVFARGASCLFAAQTPTLAVIERDPDDDKFIECAVALNASTIISGDKDLLSLGRYFDIEILSPRSFLDTYHGAENPVTDPS